MWGRALGVCVLASRDDCECFGQIESLYTDVPLRSELGQKNLDAVVVCVGDEDVPASAHSHCHRAVELLISLATQRREFLVA